MLDRSGWLLVTAGFVLLLFVVYFVDVPVVLWAESTLEPVHGVFEFITEFGESIWILLPALILLPLTWLLARVARPLTVRVALLQMTGIWAFILVGVGLPGLLINLVKRVIGRGRPLNLEEPDAPVFQYLLNDWTYQSFPSGHATTAFAFCFVASFLAPRTLPWMLALATLIALSRIIIGAHYPTDVLGGVVLGTLGAYAVRNFFAARGWVFRLLPDGRVVPRRLAAVQRLVAGRTRPAQPSAAR
jgi:membrane-associated phospholipid phosphatase